MLAPLTKTWKFQWFNKAEVYFSLSSQLNMGLSGEREGARLQAFRDPGLFQLVGCHFLVLWFPLSVLCIRSAARRGGGWVNPISFNCLDLEVTYTTSDLPSIGTSSGILPGRGELGYRCKIVQCLLHKHVCVPSCISHVQLFATPWTVAHQAPLSRGFSRQEYWSE